MATKKAVRCWIKTSLITGEPHNFSARDHGDRLYTIEYKGKVYSITPKQWYDSYFSANDNDTWKLVGDPYESRRSRAQAARGKLALWEQRALDAKLLDVIGSYPGGSGTTWLYEDLFNNHGWSWSRGDAERFGGSGELSALAAKALYWKPTQRAIVASSVARLKKKGLLTDVWNARAGKEYVQVVRK